MALTRLSSPHLSLPGNAGNVMRLVLLALLPGLLVLSWQFGWGSLINVVWASLLALAFEAVSLLLRRRPLGFYLRDGSALVTGTLLGLALPPLVPWWITLLGVGFAIVFAKHFYGGLGYNLFNPAMVAYVVLLISFPLEMTRWLAPQDLFSTQFIPLSLSQSMAIVFTGVTPPDGYTAATALDLVKQQSQLASAALNNTLSAADYPDGRGWQWVNLAYLLGGLYLLQRRVFTWHAPLAMLATMALLSTLIHGVGSLLFHLFSGATMLGAFFIITDPVTGTASNRGRLIYGACIGALVIILRSWGNYPDAMAFSVLLMNFAAPLLDHLTVPARFGQPGLLSRLRRRQS